MKRLIIAVLVCTVLTSAGWAITPTERGMNDFTLVSTPKYAQESQPAANNGSHYNKAIEEHKAHMYNADHGKHGKKAHH